MQSVGFYFITQKCSNTFSLYSYIITDFSYSYINNRKSKTFAKFTKGIIYEALKYLLHLQTGGSSKQPD